MKIVVAFSAGTDSVAALIDSINKYGKENVMAYMIVLFLQNKRTIPWQEAQMFYGKKICDELGIELIIDRRAIVSGGHRVEPDIYEWAHCLIMFCLGNKEITKAVYGHSADDRTHRHVLLWWEIFDMCMKAQNRAVTLEHPLSNISKQGCYSIIPENIREYIWTCVKPKGVVRGKHGLKRYVACGDCGKCKEFQQKVMKDNYV
jgi:7-cyano-7-deazaguanine synthase in queuosine biosynthesis